MYDRRERNSGDRASTPAFRSSLEGCNGQQPPGNRGCAHNSRRIRCGAPWTSAMGISTGVLPDHHKNLYAIVRDRKLYYRMHTVGSSFLRFLSRHLPTTPFCFFRPLNPLAPSIPSTEEHPLLNFPGLMGGSHKRSRHGDGRKRETVAIKRPFSRSPRTVVKLLAL